MKNIIKFTLLSAVLLSMGCERKIEPIIPPKPIFQAYINMPDENWPPKENNITNSIDLSDLNITTIKNIAQNTIGKVNIIGTISFTKAENNKTIGKYSNIYLRDLKAGQIATYGDYLQSTISDSNGRFEFRKIPNGKYKVSGLMNCGLECGYETNKTITLSKIITLDKNATYGVHLSNVAQVPKP